MLLFKQCKGVCSINSINSVNSVKRGDISISDGIFFPGMIGSVTKQELCSLHCFKFSKSDIEGLKGF